MVMRGRVAVIGDLVKSRQARRRDELQMDMERALKFANRLTSPADALAPSLGDEFQGLYGSIDEALAATLIVQLCLGPRRVRIGVGAGRVSIYRGDSVPFRQDGSAWWAARDAIEATDVGVGVCSRFRSHSPNSVRSRLRRSGGVVWEQLPLPGFERYLPDEKYPVSHPGGLVNAFLTSRDAYLLSLGGRDRRIGLRLIEGASQERIGEEEAISQSAVSQRVARSTLRALPTSFRNLQGDQE